MKTKKKMIIKITTGVFCLLLFVSLFGVLKTKNDSPKDVPTGQSVENETLNEDTDIKEEMQEAHEEEDKQVESEETTASDGAQQETTQPEETMPPQKQETPKVEAIPGQHRDPNSAVIVIDPGHQLRGDSTKEPNGPGSSTMKARVTSGTTGVVTGVAEYILNLDVSLKLKTELENRGYTVYMTRSTHDVNISNKERAEYAATVGADIAVRIHGNGSSNSTVCGAETYVPSANNPYISHLATASRSLGQYIIDAYCNATGLRNRGVFTSDIMTGMNWSSVPVTILELGYMSNGEEDRKMQDLAMQNNMVQGIANGIDAYFGF